jgi:hypothetical protein
MEGWNNGIVKWWNWNSGILEYWNTGILNGLFNEYGSSFHPSIIPSFHHSIIPTFQFSILQGFWQGDGKGAALIHGARYGNVPAMSPGNGPCQAETQPCSRLGSALIAAVESFENAGQVSVGDADSRVFHGDSYIVVLGPSKRNLDFSA